MSKLSKSTTKGRAVSKKMEEITGNDLVDLMGEDPTLDRFFDTEPDRLTDDDLFELIEGERKKRAIFIDNKR